MRGWNPHKGYAPKKVADRLLADGLERLQYSVFVGPLREGVLHKLRAFLQSKIQQADRQGDKVMILRILDRELADMEWIGEQVVDLDLLLGKKSTLFL
ncbi:MAG: CRISPR-associated endonuclease Cas2 [Bacteroidota bacterium]